MHIIYIVLVLVAFMGGYLWGRIRREKPNSSYREIRPPKTTFKGKPVKVVDDSVSPQKIMLDRLKTVRDMDKTKKRS